MHSSRTVLLLIGSPAVLASFAVLALGGVGKSVWLIQLVAIGLSCLLALAGNRFFRLARASVPGVAIIVLTLAGVAAPLLHHRPGPNRWASMGPLMLYMAPVLIPSFLVACSVCARKRRSYAAIAFAATIGLSLLLVAQPDASQALALLVGSTIAFTQARADRLKVAITLAFVSAATGWAFFRPDPLQPVPHVEGVFALALSHSLFAGVAVIASAVALVVGLYLSSFRGSFWLFAVSAYYGVLFACSIGGLTPAPLIGYGAGPLLGYGLMVAVSRWAEAEVLPNNSSKPTPLRGAA